MMHINTKKRPNRIYNYEIHIKIGDQLFVL